MNCEYMYEHGYNYESTLFMVECHIMETHHFDGYLIKTDLDNKMNAVIKYRKHSTYTGSKTRFKLRKVAQ